MEDFSHLLTGFAKCKVIAVNPDRELYEEINEEMLDKDPVYAYEKGGIRKAVIDIYLADTGGMIFRHRIFLTDKDDVSTTGKFRYINCIGESQWVEEPDQLWDNFMCFEKLEWSNAKIIKRDFLGPKEYRIAKQGEADLYLYRSRLLNIDKNKPSTNILLDMDAIFKGDFSELQGEIETDSFHFLALIYADLSFKQKVWKEFLPVQMLGEINSGMQFSKYTSGIWNRWKANVDRELQGHYSFSRLKVFTKDDIKIKKILTPDGPDF